MANDNPLAVENNVLRNMLASSVGASAVAMVLTPMDVVRVRMQAHVCSEPRSTVCVNPGHTTNVKETFARIIKSDGFHGLYRGLSLTLFQVIPSSAVYIAFYETIQAKIRSQYDYAPSKSALVAGPLARTVATFLAAPLELVRTRLQAGNSSISFSPLVVTRELIQSGGIYTLYRGIVPSLLRDVPFSLIYWSTYELCKENTFISGQLNHSDLLSKSISPGHPVHALFSGTIAGSTAALCTIPADVVKTKIQAGNMSCSATQACKDIFTQHGLKGFFRGLIPRTLKVAPACAIMMGTFELFRNYLLI